MAAGLLRQAAKSRGLISEVASAGLAALRGEAPDPIAVRLLAARGIDISGHRAVQATEQILRRYALIFVMERRQQDFVEATWPAFKGRVFRWGHWQDLDVPDPYGRDETAFRVSLSVIDWGLTAWLEKFGKACA